MRLSTLLPALALVAAPAAVAGDDTLVSDARAVIQTFKKKDPHINKFFGSAAGYAVFPTIAKGGFVVGGAGGDGVLFVGGHPVGKSSMGQPSVGFTATKTGLMYEASVGGQKFGYHPYGGKK
ncbi:MAG TPA: hypothetical protein VFF12_09600 [Myxococcaceae bacterium]|nr:hypothetical protein [Myxococcaceae bacterium]